MPSDGYQHSCCFVPTPSCLDDFVSCVWSLLICTYFRENVTRTMLRLLCFFFFFCDNYLKRHAVVPYVLSGVCKIELSCYLMFVWLLRFQTYLRVIINVEEKQRMKNISGSRNLLLCSKTYHLSIQVAEATSVLSEKYQFVCLLFLPSVSRCPDWLFGIHLE